MKYAIPGWLLEALGESIEPSLLWTDTKRFIISHPDGKDEFFDTPEAAYDSTDHNSLRLDTSLVKDGFLYANAGNASFRLLSAATDDEILWDLEGCFFEFLDDFNARFIAQPNNFMAAYKYLDNHPAFWVRENSEASITQQHWSTDNRLSKFSIEPVERGNRHVFYAEFGESAGPEYTHTYYDPELTDQAPTYEEVVIAVAQRTYDQFWPTGERKTTISADQFNTRIEALRTLHIKNTAEIKDKEHPYL